MDPILSVTTPSVTISSVVFLSPSSLDPISTVTIPSVIFLSLSYSVPILSVTIPSVTISSVTSVPSSCVDSSLICSKLCWHNSFSFPSSIWWVDATCKLHSSTLLSPTMLLSAMSIFSSSISMSLNAVSKSHFLPFLPFLFFPVTTLINTLPFNLLSLLYTFLFGWWGSQNTSSSSSLLMLSVMTHFFGRPFFLLTFSFLGGVGLCPLFFSVTTSVDVSAFAISSPF